MPILIERRMIHLKDIVEEIHQHLAEPLPEDMIEITDLWPETVSAKLRAAVLMRLQQPQVQNAIGMPDITKLRSILDTPAFESRMRKHFEHYCDEIKKLDKPRQLQLLPETDFKDLAVQSGGLRNARLAFVHVQRAMSDCLASELRVEDMIKKLDRISQRYREVGRRPVLLIEDITTFGFLQNDLLDYLYNLAGGNYDVVMGVTTGFEQENQAQIYRAQQTITERIHGRFELTDQHNETLFLRDHYLELAQRYLLAIRTDQCAGCPGNHDCLAAFEQDLYPFNPAFLGNIYRSLHQGQSRKQTPRLYLRAIQSVLESAQLPTDAIELSPNISEPGIYFAQNPGLSPAAERLIKWYGMSTNAGIFLPVMIAKVFGVLFRPDTPMVGSYYRLPLRPGAEQDLLAPPDTIATLLKAVTLPPEPVLPSDTLLPLPALPQIAPGKQDPLPPSVKALPLAQLDEWLALKGQFPDRSVFKDGVYALLGLYEFEPFVLKNPDSIAEGGSALVYDRGDKYAKVYLHHSADDRPYPKLTLRPDPQKRDLFSQVLAIGAGQYQVDDPQRLNQTQLYAWLDGAVRTTREELQQSLSQALRMPLGSFVALAKFLILNLTSHVRTFDPATLCAPITGEPLALPGIGDRGRHLWENRDHLQALFVGLFHFRDNLVNYPLLRSTVENVNPLTTLAEIERIDLASFPAGFRIKVAKSELQFADLVKVVKDYVAYLNARTRNRDYHIDPTENELRQILNLCSPRGSVDARRLRKQIDLLRGMVQKSHVIWQQRWDLNIEPLHRSPEELRFDSLYDDLTRLLEGIIHAERPLSVFAYMAFQRSAAAISSTPTFEILEAIAQMQGPLRDECLNRTLRDPKNSKEYGDYQRAYDTLQEMVTSGRA